MRFLILLMLFVFTNAFPPNCYTRHHDDCKYEMMCCLTSYGMKCSCRDFISPIQSIEVCSADKCRSKMTFTKSGKYLSQKWRFTLIPCDLEFEREPTITEIRFIREEIISMKSQPQYADDDCGIIQHVLYKRYIAGPIKYEKPTPRTRRPRISGLIE
jgi:hypothetical protein